MPKDPEKQREYRTRYWALNKDRLRALPSQSPEAQRANWLRRRYDMTPDEHALMVARQQGRCAICNAPAKLVVDHCHATKRVRGLLCSGCNISLGHMGEDVYRLRRAAEYAERHLEDTVNRAFKGEPLS